jgi:sugar phosphate isomerase/epimerase
MKFGISNLSWNLKDDKIIKSHLTNYDYIETVFSKIDLGYYSTQSIFYGSGVKTFDDFDSTLSQLNFIIDKCNECGVKIIVLGSPSLRTGNKNNLLKVFNEVDSKLKKYDIFLCIEPNSRYYGAEYYCTLSEIVEDIKNFSNIKTMIDTHNLILENVDIVDAFSQYKKYIKHIHFSEKDLVPISDYFFYHNLIDFLRNQQYNGGVTYELKLTENIVSESKKFIKLKDEKSEKSLTK